MDAKENEKVFTFADIIEDPSLAYKFTDEEFAAMIAEYEKQETALKPLDLEVRKNRTAIASVAASYPKLRTKIDDKGKELVADWKAKAKVVDNRRKLIRDTLDRIRDTVRAPLNEWEKEQTLREQRAAEDEASIVNLRDTDWKTADECRGAIADLWALRLSSEVHGKGLPRINAMRKGVADALERHLEALKRAEKAEGDLKASQATDLAGAFQTLASGPENQSQPISSRPTPSRPGYIMARTPTSISFYDKTDEDIEMVNVRLTNDGRGMATGQAVFVHLIDALGAKIWNTQGDELLRFDLLKIYPKI